MGVCQVEAFSNVGASTYDASLLSSAMEESPSPLSSLDVEAELMKSLSELESDRDALSLLLNEEPLSSLSSSFWSLFRGWPVGASPLEVGSSNGLLSFILVSSLLLQLTEEEESYSPPAAACNLVSDLADSDDTRLGLIPLAAMLRSMTLAASFCCSELEELAKDLDDKVGFNVGLPCGLLADESFSDREDNEVYSPGRSARLSSINDREDKDAWSPCRSF